MEYVIEAENPNGNCSTLKASSYNSVRSNRKGNTVSSTLGQNLVQSLNALNIYPNPSKGEFFIELNQAGLQKVAVELIDSKGQIIRNYYYKSDDDQFKNVFDISGITSGVYILKISSDSNVNFRKLVIQP